MNAASHCVATAVLLIAGAWSGSADAQTAGYEGSERQRQDKALLRLIEPAARGDEPGAHACNQAEREQYRQAEQIVERGEAGGYARSDVDGARLTIELIEHRCGSELKGPAEEGRAAAGAGNEDFPLSHAGWSATLTAVTQPDSPSAAALGTVMRINAMEYCKRDPGGETGGTPEGLARCVESVLDKEKGKRHVILANCPQGKIRTSRMGSFVFTGVFEDADGNAVYPWKHAETGEVLDGSMASGGATVDAQFGLVCPSYKTW